jgi:hypothetical protein
MTEEPGAMALELPRVTEPISAPTTLQNLVEEYNSRAKLGETQLCALLLRDALGYFARYYAAVCVAACRELECLPGEIAQTWTGTPAVEVALPALDWCLERLKGRQERLARKLVGVFFDKDGNHRKFAHHCLPSIEGEEFQVSVFCSAAAESDAGRLVDYAVASQAARVLDAWIGASFGFFLESEQRLETGAYFGQLEQVVRFEQHTLRTGLTMRVRESRGVGGPAAPGLAAPAAGAGVALALPAPGDVREATAHSAEAATVVPEELAESVAGVEPSMSAAAPESSAQASAGAELAGPAPSEEQPVPLPPPAVAVNVAPEAQALQSFLHTQQQRGPVAAGGAGAAPPRKSEESRLMVRLEPLGFVRSKTGKIGYGGFLWVDSATGEDVQGVVEATGGDVELTGSFFEGVSNRVVYWVHPDDVATGREYLKIRSEGEERLYALWKLAPPSRFENLNLLQQSGLLMVPGLLGVLYSLWILYSTHAKVYSQLLQTLESNFSRFINTTAPLSLRQAGIGELDVNLKPQIESAVLIFLCVGWLVPVLATKLYARFPRRDQKRLTLLYVLGCSLPLLAYLALWSSSLGQSVVTQHPELAYLDYRRNFAVFACLNAFSTVYLMISVEGVLHRFLNELGRWTLSILMGLLASCVILLQVYGQSWFG